ncbi:MAG: hypothetical protein E6L03_09030 [Thaumarchaeota archaeon]|nr:MAG: hypothetical protein E6L03_09030 [Nitrososphaerota archaeon]
MKGRGDNDSWHDSESEHTFHGQSVKSKNPHNIHTPFHGEFNKNQGYTFIIIVVISLSLGLPFTIYSTQVSHNNNIVTLDKDPFTTLWNGQISSSYSTQSGSSSPITFKSKVNASLSGMSVNLPAIIVTSSDTMVVTLIGPNAFDFGCSVASTISITDTQSNTYTLRVQSPDSVGSGANTCIYTATMASSGSDTITVSTTPHNEVWTISALDYSGTIGFGSIGTDEKTVNPTDSSTITMSIDSTASVIVEAQMLTYNGNSAVITESSGQTIRNPFKGTIFESTTDVSNKVGSSTFTFSWVISGTPCTTPNFCRLSHSALELKTSPIIAKTCGQIGYQCSHMNVTNGYFVSSRNSTFPAIALTNSSIDLSTGASKAIAFNFGLVTNTPFVGEEFGFFLRANGTLPLTSNWSPTNDTTTTLAVIVTVTSGKYNYYVYIQRQTGQSLFTGTENPTIPCNQASTIYLCANNSTKADATFPIFPLVLNYTGSANGSSGAGQSYLCNDFGGGSTQCNLGGANNVAIGITNTNFRINYTEPWLNIQNRYYVGLWQKSTSNPTLVKFQTATQNVQSAQVISIYSPSSTNSNVVEGGFFGWIGNALGGAFNVIGSTLAPIINPITGLGNSLISVFISGMSQLVSLFATSIVTALNLIGNRLGLGNVGTNVANFFTSIGAFLTNVIGGIFTFFTNSGTFIGNIVAIVDSAFNSISLLGLWVSFLGAIPTIISALDTFFGYLLFWYNLGVFGFNIIIIIALIILAMASLVDYEQSGNPIAIFVGIILGFFTFYVMTLSNTSINVIATNPTVLSNYQTAFNNTVFFIKLAPILFILMLGNYISDGSDLTSFTHGGNGFMHNFTSTLHFYEMIVLDLFKAGHFLFVFGMTIIVTIKQLVAGWL